MGKDDGYLDGDRGRVVHEYELLQGLVTEFVFIKSVGERVETVVAGEARGGRDGGGVGGEDGLRGRRKIKLRTLEKTNILLFTGGASSRRRFQNPDTTSLENQNEKACYRCRYRRPAGCLRFRFRLLGWPLGQQRLG